MKIFLALSKITKTGRFLSKVTNTLVFLKKQQFILILILFTGFTGLFGQNYSTTDKKAIKYFETAMTSYRQRQFEETERNLKMAIERDSNFQEAHLELALFYAESGNRDQAIVYLNSSIKIDSNKYPSAHYYLGKFYLKKGDYENAQASIEKALSMQLNDLKQVEDANRMLQQCAFALKHKDEIHEFEPKNLGPSINSRNPEYYPCLTADDELLLFTRQIPSAKTLSGLNEDFYVSMSQKGKWQPSKNMGPPINSLNNEGAPTLAVDGNLLIFTACPLYGDYGPGRKGLGSCDLFFTQRSGNQWSPPMNLGPPVNSKHWETQPSFSSDGRTLYFVRGVNTSSGIKEQDIYKTFLTDTGWTKPVKLSNVINSPGREESVFIHPDGKTLYFASDGHPGYGGLDIFMSVLDSSGNWSEPKNLGAPINTSDDENSLMVNARGDKGYFASDRPGGHGSLDLYEFNMPEEIRPGTVTFMKGKVFNSVNGKPLLAKFELIDLESGETVIESYSNGGNGSFLVCLPPNKDYALNCSRDGFLFYSDNFTLTNEVGSNKPYIKDVPLIPMVKDAKVVLNNIFFETGKYNLKPQSKVELNRLIKFLLKNDNVSIEIGGHTDNTGTLEINKSLSENRARSVYKFLIDGGIPVARLSYKGYADTQPVASNDSAKGRAKNRRTEFKITDVK